ncbi:MAG: hypothetical protein OXN92_02330 [Gammaproteobacteria bacterium]|nr:hypothetical protein [Gammaproteobacteria bacterium]
MKSFVLAATLPALALATGSRLIGAQSIQSRPAAEVRLSADPVLSVGMLDGPDEYLFGEINAGSLLADGSVVVSDRMNFRIQRFGSDGEHLWSRGREGEGPGEFENVQIVHGCVSAGRIVVYDIWTPRVTVFNDEGDLVDDYRLLYNGLPIRRFGCAPNGRLGFTGDSDQTIEGLASEELYRELMTLGWVELGDTAATTVRQRIQGSERRYLGPGDAMPGSIWAHNVAIAVATEGIWFGSSENYEVELIGWTGETIRRIRWQGPDLNVTQRDVDRYRDALEGSYRRGGNPDWRARFERRWAWESENVPDVFPAYDRLMIGDDGVLWVHDYVRPGEPSEWFAFAADGTWIRTLVLPPRTLLLDIGRDWALVRTLDDVDVQRVAVHALVENR